MGLREATPGCHGGNLCVSKGHNFMFSTLYAEHKVRSEKPKPFLISVFAIWLTSNQTLLHMLSILLTLGKNVKNNFEEIFFT